MNGIKQRLAKLERELGGGRRRDRLVVVIRDDFGHEIWPPGDRPRDGDEVHTIRIGGIDVERDI